MRLAGYLIHTRDGPIGERGSAYTYVLAGNGLLLEAENRFLEARVLLAPASVRGLPPLEPYLRLKQGRIPRHLLELALGAMAACPDWEMFAAIAWDGEYRLVLPAQDRGEGHVTYEPVPGTVVGAHSHGRMGAFFSATDDADDQGFQVSLVLGELWRLVPRGRARLALYGYFAPVDLSQVFSGTVPWVEEKKWNQDIELPLSP